MKSRKLGISAAIFLAALISTITISLISCSKSGVIHKSKAAETVVYEQFYHPIVSDHFLLLSECCFLSNEKNQILLLAQKPKRLYRYILANSTIEEFPSRNNQVFDFRPQSIAHDQQKDGTYVFGNGVLTEINKEFGTPRRQYRILSSFPIFQISNGKMFGFNNSAFAKPIFFTDLEVPDKIQENWVDMTLDKPQEKELQDANSQARKLLKDKSLLKMTLETIKRTYNLCYMAPKNGNVLFVRKRNGDIYSYDYKQITFLYSLNELFKYSIEVLDLKQEHEFTYVLVRDAQQYSFILKLDHKGKCLGKYIFGDAAHGRPFQFLVLQKGNFLALTYSDDDETFGFATYGPKVQQHEVGQEL